MELCQGFSVQKAHRLVFFTIIKVATPFITYLLQWKTKVWESDMGRSLILPRILHVRQLRLDIDLTLCLIRIGIQRRGSQFMRADRKFLQEGTFHWSHWNFPLQINMRTRSQRAGHLHSQWGLRQGLWIRQCRLSLRTTTRELAGTRIPKLYLLEEHTQYQSIKGLGQQHLTPSDRYDFSSLVISIIKIENVNPGPGNYEPINMLS